MTPQDLDAVAREIIDANLYMTLGTADETGSPEATHSRNLAARPELELGIETFSRVSLGHGAPAWTLAGVQAPALHRLYRATAAEHSVLDPSVRGMDHRTPVAPG